MTDYFNPIAGPVGYNQRNELVVGGVAISMATFGALSGYGDYEAATLVGNAATLSKWWAVITTEALTTAAGASQAFVLTLSGVTAGAPAFVTRAGGTNTRRNYDYDAATTADTVTVTVYNTEPANALNGTLVFSLWVVK